jgi:hypothetical protein
VQPAARLWAVVTSTFFFFFYEVQLKSRETEKVRIEMIISVDCSIIHELREILVFSHSVFNARENFDDENEIQFLLSTY